MNNKKQSFWVFWTLLKVISLSVFVIGSIVFLFILLSLGEGTYVSGEVLLSWLSISGSIILFASILLLSVFMIWLIRVMFKHKEIFGSNPVARILGFGVIALFYSDAVYFTFIAPIRFVINLFSQLPQALRQFTGIVNPQANFSIDQITDYFLMLVVTIASELTWAIDSLLGALPISDIIIALAIWVFIGQLISSVSASSDEISDDLLGKSRISQFINNMPKARRMNVLLSGIFFISGYLCIASIVAIPWLQQEESPEILNMESLEQRLSESLISFDTIDSGFQQMVREEADLFEPLSSILDTTFETNSTQDSTYNVYISLWEQNISRIKTEMTNIQRRRDNFLSEWRRIRDQIPNKQDNLLQTAVSDFEANTIAPMSTHERSYYFQDIVRWFQDSISQLQRPLDDGLIYFNDQEDSINRWIDTVKSSLEEDMMMLNKYDSNSTLSMGRSANFGNSYITDYIFTDYFRLFQLPTVELRPTPPEPGLGLGIFGWISSWLLRTRSFPLVLISGMLGFGLLGAAISSFVREQVSRKDNDQSEPLVKDLVGVLVRGLSAAVVVFLAVIGGLAIFTEGAQEPNAYVLFFTCLVGAVFSDDVWIWARSKLGDNFTGDKNGKKDDTNNTESKED